MKRFLPIVLCLACACAVTCVSYDPHFDYLGILRSGSGYSEHDSSENPVFTYQSPEEPELRELRETFGLAAIAGNGDEFSRIAKLLGWVHDTIRHNGSVPMPPKRDALSILRNGSKSGQNCRILSIVANEVFLAMGFKSRFVTCLPRDYSTDCHVVVLVYLNSLEKWVFVDPSYEAWFTNEEGTPQSLEEIRERMIQGETLIINKEANYNNGPMDLDYLHYLSKNLYWFETPLDSRSGWDSKANGTRAVVRLYPLGYTSPVKQRKTSVIASENPRYFWQSPRLLPDQ